jgi:hypothetical protein
MIPGNAPAPLSICRGFGGELSFPHSAQVVVAAHSCSSVSAGIAGSGSRCFLPALRRSDLRMKFPIILVLFGSRS